jgi:phosphodiesterase/alkaline phosphatase D-like protein
MGAAILGILIITSTQLIGGSETDSTPVAYKAAPPQPQNSEIGTIVLGRPTDTSVTANILPDKNWEAVLQYGTTPNSFAYVSAPYKSNGKQPINIELNGLRPNTQYYYRLAYRTDNNQAYQTGAQYKFHTARAKGENFVFAVQADTHFDINSSDLYKITAQNILNSNPDFVIDLGDKLMSGGYAKNYNETYQQYMKPRQLLSFVGSSAPLFLVNGNHDGENGWLDKGRGNDITAWSIKVRKLLFNNPYPNDFYTGNNTLGRDNGYMANYYSWQWGDALFVVLDSFYKTKDISTANTNEDLWNMTLGDEQYNWLRQTLQTSTAKYKFVFAHHILGYTLHGGVNWAKYGEWGGYNKNDSWGFDVHRPGWQAPITKLFSDNGVNIFFQGHDHIFAVEKLKGVTYQEVPQPNSLYGQAWLSRKFTYNGVTQASSGYLRVSVSPDNAKVDYVRSYTQNPQAKNQRNADISHTYNVYPSY